MKLLFTTTYSLTHSLNHSLTQAINLLCVTLLPCPPDVEYMFDQMVEGLVPPSDAEANKLNVRREKTQFYALYIQIVFCI